MVDGIQVFAVLVAVVKAAAGDLRELAGAVETLRGEGVGRVGVDAPVGTCGGVTAGVEGFTVVEEAFVAAVPGVRFFGEGVGGVRGSFVVSVDLEI